MTTKIQCAGVLKVIANITHGCQVHIKRPNSEMGKKTKYRKIFKEILPRYIIKIWNFKKCYMFLWNLAKICLKRYYFLQDQKRPKWPTHFISRKLFQRGQMATQNVRWWRRSYLIVFQSRILFPPHSKKQSRISFSLKYDLSLILDLESILLNFQIFVVKFECL
jgi:hypothetical protein